MGNLKVYNQAGLILHDETVKLGSAIGARRVTKQCADIVAANPGCRVLVTTLRGEETREIVKVGRRWYTRVARTTMTKDEVVTSIEELLKRLLKEKE